MTSGGETAPGGLTGPGSGGGGRRGGAAWLGGTHWQGIARPRSARRELTLALLLGVAGAAMIFLATRQAWAQVRTTPPKPLPASLVTVTGAALVPYADALMLASLASLAAVMASRRLLRRLIGVLLAVLGAALAASVVSLSRAGAIAAAAASTNPATAGAGGDAGQCTGVIGHSQCGRCVIPCHVYRGRVAGPCGNGRRRPGGSGRPRALAGGPDGGHVEPLRRAIRCGQARRGSTCPGVPRAGAPG